jgi:peptidoglycan/xylan/chitin deacetylase (PgdA/CDA1 family)
MSLKHRALSALYHPLRIMNFSLGRLGVVSGSRLRVLIYHDIADHEYGMLKSQLGWLSKRWDFVDAGTFTDMLSGRAPILRDSLLLTFDDGFISCRHAAESVLDELQIKALFFVVTEFAFINGEEWREFVAANINPHMQPSDVQDYCRNMTIDDLHFLLEQGHTIGAHTGSHASLKKLAGEALVNEVVESADILERALGTKLKHFAYTFGNLANFSSEALEVARGRFPYIYTGLRGDNAQGRCPWAICRDSAKPSDGRHLVGSFLEGGADRLYAADLAIYKGWGRSRT